MAGSDEIRIPRGTVDLSGEELRRVEWMEGRSEALFRRYGYSPIRTPVFEETRLFARAIGEGTDVVEKEMFSIPRERVTYSLRPEGTASVVRHYLEASLHKVAPFQKLFYIGPMFRYERPQAGRQRQFLQVGVEAFGSLDPLLDVEVILLLDDLFRSLGMTGQRFRVNTIGSAEARTSVRGSLRAALSSRESDLCALCRKRIERNVFRVLDCKEERCQALTADLPHIEDLVDEESRAHYERVLAGLSAAGVPFERDHRLVRGLDYYTRTVFEAVHPALGAQDSICGGGRYDGLVEELGGPSIPAVGFAVGVERVLMALDQLGVLGEISDPGLDAYVVAVKPEVRESVFTLVLALRSRGVSADLDYEGRGMRAQMKKAARSGARYALIIGPGEVERGTVTLRDLATKEQWESPVSEAMDRLAPPQES